MQNETLREIAKRKKQEIEEETYKQNLFSLKKWELIKTKRESMLKNLRVLRRRHDCCKQWIIQATLVNMVRQQYENYQSLIRQKQAHQERVFATLVLVFRLRAQLRRYGST